MSEFTIEDLGDGKFSISGELTFDTAERMLRASESLFDDHTQIDVDLTDIT
jgi:ABC-type transporter Mla MlaB component